MKRPAAAAKGPMAKKPATAKSMAAGKVKTVVDAVTKAEGFPDSTLRMLAGTVAGSLGVAKEERHHFQVQVCTMVGEVLASVEAAAKAAITEAETKATELAGSKSTLEAKAEAAAAELTAKSGAADGAKAAVAEAATALKAAKAALATAETDEKASAAELDALTAKKTLLESALAEAFAPLKEGTKEDVKAGVSTIGKLGKEFAFDHSLMASLPSALSKAPADRGSFDSMVIGQVEGEIGKKIVELTGTLAGGEPAKAAAAEKVAAATAELTAATEKDTASKAALEAAKAAAKEAEAASKAATKELKDFEPANKKAAKELESLTGALTDLTAGPLAAYAELLELSNVPPPEPEPEEPAEPAPAEPAPAEVAA